MSIPTKTHACAVCLRPAKAGMLMCLACWRLLPIDQQSAVSRAWRAFERRTAGDAKALLAAYREVRTLAINTVRTLRN